MNKAFIRLGVAVIFLAVSSSAFCVSAATETYAVNVNFEHGSTAITFEKAKLDAVACHASNMNMGAIILVGHAEETESNTQMLSERRAQSVKDQLLLLGLPANQIYLEGKGATQPFSLGEPSLNKTVQVEVMGYSKGNSSSKTDCVPVWERSFVELEPTKAIEVATRQVNDGFIAPHTPAVVAIVNKRMDLLDLLLTGTDQIALGADDRVILMRAAILAGDSRFVERLLSFGIKVNELRHSFLPVTWAVCDTNPERVSETESMKMVEALLAWGGTVNGVSQENGLERSALQCSAKNNRMILTDLLLANGANPDWPVSSPPIIAAARYPEIVRRLANAGADLRATTAFGATLLHIYRFDSPQDVEWLIQRGADINAREDGGFTPILYAARYASQAVLKAFIDYGATLDPVRGETIFHNFRFTNPDEVEWFAGLGLDINSFTERGYTPLRKAVPYASRAVLETFVDHGASLELKGALLVDSATANLPGLLWLIDKGAPLEGNRGIVYSVATKGDAAIPVIEALHRRGVSIREANESGNTPLQLAIRELAPNLVRLLVDYGAVERPGEARVARMFAESQEIRRFPFCHGCSESQIKEERKLLNADDVLAERKRNKEKIVNILKAAEDGS